MSKLYQCGRCGVVSRAGEQLCSPQEPNGRQSYCGTAPERGSMCEDMRRQVPFVCGICGRPAEQEELLCKPRVLG